MSEIDTHGLIMDIGKHKGVPYTRLPVGYLTWMVGCNHSRAKYAQAELDRRGTTVPEIDVSGHAIDRASQSCRKIWHETKMDDEGIHSWLVRVAQEALDKGEKDHKGRYQHIEMRFAFEEDGVWPVLKTVMRA